MNAFPYGTSRDDEDAELRALFARRAEALGKGGVPSLEAVLAAAGPEEPARPAILRDRPPAPRARVQRLWAATVATLAVAASFAGLRLGATGATDRGIMAEPGMTADAGVIATVVRPGEDQTCEAPPMTLASSGAEMCGLTNAPNRLPSEPANGSTCDEAPMSVPRAESLMCERQADCCLANP